MTTVQQSTAELARERLIAALRDWYDLFGEVATATDWNLALARAHCPPERVEELMIRHEERDWPSPTLVGTYFDGWADAREAAGLPKHERRPSVRFRPTSLTDEQKREVISRWPKESYRKLAAEFEVSRTTIMRAVKEVGSADSVQN